MSKVSISTDRLDELRRVCEAYGADPARWPIGKRKELAFLLASDEAADIRMMTQALDGLLNAASAPRMAEDLERRIVASYNSAPLQEKRALSDVFGLMTFLSGLRCARLMPVGAIAGFGAVGLATGLMTATAQAPLTPEAEALAYFETDIVLASLEEEEDATWDAD